MSEYNFSEYIERLNDSIILKPEFSNTLKNMYLSIIVKITSKIETQLTELGHQLLFLTSFVILSKFENERRVNLSTLYNFSPITFEVKNLAPRIAELELMILKYINFDIEKFK